jgi:hypothetical protein
MVARAAVGAIVDVEWMPDFVVIEIDGKTVPVFPEEVKSTSERLVGAVRQVRCDLYFACTFFKVQGKSLDRVVIDCAVIKQLPMKFPELYVALSRGRKVESVKLLNPPLTRMKFVIDKEVRDWAASMSLRTRSTAPLLTAGQTSPLSSLPAAVLRPAARATQSTRSRARRQLGGIENGGNTCFAGSVLQLLLRCSFVGIAMSEGATDTQRCLQELVRQMQSGCGSVQAVLAQLPGFADGQQHDVDEFLTAFVSRLMRFDVSDATPEIPFVGFLQRRRECAACHATSVEQPAFLIQTLRLPSDEGVPRSLRVSTLFAESCTVTEVLSAPCGTCYSFGTVRQDEELLHAPSEVLFVSLGRFVRQHGGSVKSDVPIAIDEMFAVESSGGRRTTFVLLGFVEHEGAEGQGHFTAVVKDGDKWLFANDRSVSGLTSASMTDRLFNNKRVVLLVFAAQHCSR